jgi:predicted nucleic acid-binding Zn ribbon protein
MRGSDGGGRQEGPRPLGASLDAVSRRLGVTDSKGFGRLFAQWPAIVGEVMAAHVQPVRLDQGVLLVVVDHPAWATQIRRLGDDLLQRVAEETGGARPTRLEVRVRR